MGQLDSNVQSPTALSASDFLTMLASLQRYKLPFESKL
jgi:hypothetical protein